MREAALTTDTETDLRARMLLPAFELVDTLLKLRRSIRARAIETGDELPVVSVAYSKIAAQLDTIGSQLSATLDTEAGLTTPTELARMLGLEVTQ